MWYLDTFSSKGNVLIISSHKFFQIFRFVTFHSLAIPSLVISKDASFMDLKCEWKGFIKMV